MNKSVFFLAGLLIICSSQIMAQKYSAKEFWKMEHDSIYNSLIMRQNNGDTLSVQETESILRYKSRLDEFFRSMPDNEKSFYFRYRSTWEKKPSEITEKSEVRQEPEIFLGERSTYTKYVISSGIIGLYYGIAAVSVFDLKGEGNVAIPLFTSGASTLLPLLFIREQNTTYSSLKLSQHGKKIGIMHGLALSMIFSGKDATDNSKLALGLSSVTSIGLGWLGYRIGRDTQMTPGNAALYSYYGSIMPFESLAFAAAWDLRDSRLYGLSILAGGAAGYLIANKVSKRYSFTPGDIKSTKAFTALNAILGVGILADAIENNNDDPTLLLIPIATTLGGTFASHYWLKGVKLTTQQGRNTALAAAGGAIMGFGVASFFDSESVTPRYLLPYVSGLSSYAILLHLYKKINLQQSYGVEQENRWKIDIMPQNIFLNQKLGKIVNPYPGRRQPLSLPAVSAICSF
jgi:hypothetical protein